MSCHQCRQSYPSPFVFHLADLSGMKYTVSMDIMTGLVSREEFHDFDNPFDLSFDDCGFQFGVENNFKKLTDGIR